ncbi:BatD family protein [Vibrio genomosp. F10]|uniref:BatD family protein n=1 Tax=Vibrio genomosp. F10 TaxID=723171 RepID=UPI0002D27D83|nr:BatD family protein [Vibrio genomosp. F10]OEF07730.1 hypothetical protein A1QI_16920 [Vibrio genomosp. F10 str. 9ZB36]
MMFIPSTYYTQRQVAFLTLCQLPKALRMRVQRIYQPLLLTLVLTFVAVTGSLFVTSAVAADIYDLQKSGDVAIRAWVGKNPDESVGAVKPGFSIYEQVIFTIEVSTPRWLTGGTRIGEVDIPNAFSIQRNQLATNYTERVKGVTWSRQRWEVTIYPQVSGEFVIPAIPVRVKVSAPNGLNVAGTLYTQPMKFDASLPSGKLSQETAWFTATEVGFEQAWRASSDDLKVGDAITRRVTVSAKDSLSILLPALLTNQSTQQYQAYPQPNFLDDTQERGNYRSSRTEESVYVIQQGGELTLPDYSFQWWDSKNQRLETAVVKGEVFKARHTLQSFIKTYFLQFVIVISVAIALVTLLMVVNRYYRNKPAPSWWVLRCLLKDGQWPEIRTFVYEQLRLQTSQLELSKTTQQVQWQADSERFQQGEENKTVLMRLWKGLRLVSTKPSNHRLFSSIILRLKLPKALLDLEDKLK